LVLPAYRGSFVPVGLRFAFCTLPLVTFHTLRACYRIDGLPAVLPRSVRLPARYLPVVHSTYTTLYARTSATCWFNTRLRAFTFTLTRLYQLPGSYTAHTHSYVHLGLDSTACPVPVVTRLLRTRSRTRTRYALPCRCRFATFPDAFSTTRPRFTTRRFITCYTGFAWFLPPLPGLRIAL